MGRAHPRHGQLFLPETANPILAPRAGAHRLSLDPLRNGRQEMNNATGA